MKLEKVNLHNRPLRQFKAGETLYLRRIKNDYMQLYECEFIGIEKGSVKVKIIGVGDGQQFLSGMVGKEITSRAKNFYLYGGKDKDHRWDYCHWFKGLDTPAGS